MRAQDSQTPDVFLGGRVSHDSSLLQGPWDAMSLSAWGSKSATQLFSDPGKKGTLFGWKTILSGGSHQKKWKKGATELSWG